MRITITLLTLLQSVLLFAQTADISTGCAPLSVKFTPPTGATSFFWDFKDGGTSVLSSPSNIFTTPGTYAVEFKASPGGAVLGTVTVTVYPKPEVNIVATPPSGCVPLTVQFSDSSKLAGDIQVLKYAWVFGDGGSGNGQTLSHIYNTVGSFTVSLELTTNYGTCNITQVFPDKIKTGIKPLVNFTTAPSPPVACDPPLTVNFTNTTVGTGTLTYAWNFANGNTSNLVTPPAQTYTQVGNFNVTLTATDLIGCSATASSGVVIGHPPAAFTVKDTVCVGDSVLFTNNSAFGNYAWNFGPNATPATSNKANPKVAFNAPGLQTVTLTVTTSTGCSSTVTKQILADLANPAFTVAPTYACSDPAVFSLNAAAPPPAQYNWQFSNNTNANTKSPTYIWTSPDTTGYTTRGLFLDTIRLEVTTAAGCKASSFKVDSIWRPNARFLPSVAHGCAPLSVVFSDSSISKEPITTWTWLFDDGSAPQVANNNSPVSHTFTKAGDYQVRLAIRNSAGCVDTSYVILIEVGAPIAGTFSVDKAEVCLGDTVRLTNTTNDPRLDAWHFASEDNRLWHCQQDTAPIWVYTSQTGLQDISLTTEYNGCFFTVTKQEAILVKGPLAQLHYKTTCDNTLNFGFTSESQDATQLTWYLGDGDSTNQASFSHLYDAPGTYTVVLKAENPSTGCPISYDTALVYPTVLKSVFDLPDTICGGTMIKLDGSKSTDVNATCYKGYTWYFSFQRPIRTDKAQTDFTPGPSGEQTFCLEVEDINGCKDTLCDTVMIYNRSPVFTVSDDTICLPATVTFTDQSTADATIVKWEWDFGDGTKSTLKNPTHTYTTPPPNGQTSFTVMLRIEDDKGCPAFASKDIFVYKPVSNILTVPNPANICSGQVVAFAASDFTKYGSHLSWQWDFGNGNTGTGPSSQQTYSPGGQYPVKLVYTEIATGCKDSTFLPVNVQDYPQATFSSTVDNLNIICYPQNISLTNTTIGAKTTLWDLGNGNINTDPQVSTVFPKGTFTVTMITATSFGCPDTVSRNFTVVGPEGDFTLDKNKICVGDPIKFTLKDTVSVSSWSWSFGDGNTQIGGNPVTHTYGFKPPSGSTTVKLVLKGEDDACAITVEHPVNFSQVNANFTTQAPSVCLGLPTVFVNTSVLVGAWNYDWNFGDGQTDGNTTPPGGHSYSAEGTYTVTLIATDPSIGCMDTIQKSVLVTGIPNLNPFGATVCPGDTALIGLDNPPVNGTFVWTPVNQVLPPSNEATVLVVVSQTTDFIVSVTDGQGCKDVDTARVIVPTPYSGASNLDTIVSKGDQVLLPVVIDPDYTFEWTPSPGPTGNPPVVTAPDTSITYTLKVRDKQNCTEKEYTFNIRVVPEKVFAPNSFTPNNDMHNDDFHLLAKGEEALVEVLSLRIYNRWGQKVFEGKGQLPDVAWDGKVDGKEAPTDVYVWTADVLFATGRKATLKGDLTLLR